MAENTTTPVTMEIINSEQFKRANIRFNGKPAEEIREELKKEGWFYSRNHNVWYPKNDAAENSLNFANHIKETYFPENQEVKIITEASEKDELAAMVKNGSSLNDILSKLSDMYGEDAVHEAFAQAKEGIEAKKETSVLKPMVEEAEFLNSVNPNALEIAVVNKNNGDYIHIQQSDEYGWDYTSFTKDYREIDGGVADDIPDSKETEDIRVAAKAIIKSLYPESDYPDWEQTNLANFQSKVEEVEAAAYDKAVESAQKNWEDHNNGVEQANDERESKEMNAELSRLDAEAEAMERANGLREMEADLDDTGLSPEQKEIRIAQSKFGDIVRGTFLSLSDEEKENGTTVEQKNARYEKWFRPMVDEIMAEIGSGNKEVMAIVQNFDLNHESHIQGNKWYSADEAYTRDVQYKLLPEMYEKVQDRIKKEYEEKKIPYVVMYSSESPKFPSENKVYTVKEFNEILLQADSEFHNRKKYAEEKYGSADNYWDLERDDKLPEEDKGIQFGYDKTNFKFFNIPNPNNPEDTFSYEPSRYDIGDGNGSVFDYVRSTCSHDEFIEALNALETQLYFPGVTETQRQFVEKTVEEATQNLKATLKEKMEDLDKAQNEYKELHKKWLIEATEADRVDEMLKNALDGVKDAYDSSMNDVFTKVLGEYPFASGDVAGSEFLKYTANEVKKMAVSELYLPSRNAQKAMNAEDYKTYNSIDWAKLRRIWEKFPANVNMTAYAEKLLQDKCAEKGMSVSENTKAVTPPETTTEVHTDNEIPLKEFIDSDMTFDEEDTILHNKVTGKYVWLYRETGGGVGKFEYDSSFNETSREPLSYAGMKSIIRGAILEKNMDEWTVFKDKRYFKPFQETEMSEEEREEFKQSVTSDNKAVTKETELTPEDIELCKKVIPPAQFKFTMELTEGEEGEFFRNKMKEIADTYRRINTDSELINEDGTHNVGFRYFLGDTEIFLSEIDSDGIGFGYNILNGDLQMSEWGSTSLEEIMKIPYIEMDYHVPEGMTIEAMLHKEHPDYFEAPAVKKDTEIESSDAKTIRAEYPNGLDQGDIENHVSKTQKDQISKEVLKLERERGWAFNYDELLDYINQYEKAVNSNDWETIYKIDYHLTDSNFHTECSLLAEYKFEECRKLIAKNFNITLKDESVSWDELKNFFKDNLRDWQADFDTTKQEVQNEKYETEREEKEETAGRLLMDNLNWADYAKDGQDTKDDELAAKVLEEKWSIVEAVEAEIVTGRVKNFDEAQIMVNDKMLNSELYKEVHEKLNSKPYNFFVNDTANLDLGIGAEIEPVTGLTAEQAVLKYAELKEKGLSPYIGLNIPGDIVFDDKEGQGAGIFTETEGKPSFYIGDNFVKGLKENDEHARNVLAAYKELYENADKYILGVEKPNFVFDKEAELNRPAEPLKVYTFSPFGYEGTIVQVETDLRRGIPAYDIVGIADSAVKETRERIRAAFTNSGLDFPSERVLQSLSPADLRKDSPMDLSMALGILGQTKQYPVNEPVLALGELELSGRIRPVRGSVAAVNTAKAAGITNIVCDPKTAELLKDIDGISILTAENLKEVDEKLMSPDSFAVKTEPKLYKAETVQFNDDWFEGELKDVLDGIKMDGHFETIRAIEIAVAGKHNILTTGAPGCGKTLLTQTLMPALTPKMTEEESQSITRINSLAGLDSPKRDKLVSPFRMPHQTATIEGICGGGPNCRPGEISLAHQGTLFMDETAEFRSSVIQMLRVPLESRQITLSRAGRSTSYPADFQLAMAMNPCPCGCYGSPDKICLDSARSIEMYWKKISDPLLDRVEIKTFVQKDEKDTRKMSIDELKAQIATAYEIQRKRGVYNSHMTPEEIQKYCKLDKEGQAYLDKEEDKLTPRGKSNLLKLSLTIANMDGREEIRINDLKEARELSAPVFEKPKAFVYNPNQSDKVNVSVNNEGYLSKPVDNFLELLTSTTTEKSEAHVFERDEADKQIKFLNDEQKTWGTNNSFKIENLPEVHEEIDGYSKDNVLHNYPNFGSKEKHTYKPNLRGGARVGSGRKPTGSMTERMTICLSILQSEELKRRAKEANLTVSKYLAKELKLDNADIEEINKILEKAKNQKITAKPVPLESSLTLDDTNISRSQISDAEKERSRITEPVLNGERTGMYKAFKDFEDKGVFDIQGTTVKLAKNGGLTPTGWKQLQAAMEIYRSKKFETFRYIMIDRKTGEIADQLAITSHMPNFCNVSKPNDETLKQVISRAEEKDYLIAVCHNHPSGNTTESSFDRELTDSLDRSLRRNDGLNRFAGHIILDHDTFNLAVPSESRPGNCHWKKMEPMQVTEIDRFTTEPKPEWAGNYVGGTTALKEVAKKINETENWNDDFIPVVFTNADRNITGVQYYSKNFFENESDKIRNEFQFAAMEAGAIGAFPVITDSLWEKLGKGATDFEAVMKAHVMNDAFTDVAFNHTTMTEKYDIEAGRNYYSFYRDQSDRKIDVVSTWTPEVNPRLFPPEGVGEIRNEKVFATSNTAKIEKENFPKNQIYSKRKEIDFDR